MQKPKELYTNIIREILDKGESKMHFVTLVHGLMDEVNFFTEKFARMSEIQEERECVYQKSILKLLKLKPEMDHQKEVKALNREIEILKSNIDQLERNNKTIQINLAKSEI